MSPISRRLFELVLTSASRRSQSPVNFYLQNGKTKKALFTTLLDKKEPPTTENRFRALGRFWSIFKLCRYTYFFDGTVYRIGEKPFLVPLPRPPVKGSCRALFKRYFSTYPCCYVVNNFRAYFHAVPSLL